MSTTESVPTAYVEHFFGACHGGDLLEHFTDCGARWKRGGTGWHQQVASPGEYDFSDWDEMTETAASEDLQLLGVLNYTPEWASTAPDGATEPHHYPPSEDVVDDWRDYVRRFAERYPDVTHFEVWNEPNLRKFLRVDEERRHEVYVDRLLKPAAEVLHDMDRKVVAPSLTTEWPSDDVWTDGERPGTQWNLDANVDMIEKWLSYGDAWEYVDYLSLHYTKGATEKPTLPRSDDLMALYEYVYDEYVDAGKLDGIWNTEGGMTVVEADGKLGLEPWERPPYPQWVARYTVPLIHWALGRDWTDRDDYKFFWYHLTLGDSPEAKHLVEERDGDVVPSPTGQALHTLSDVLTAGERLGRYDGDVRVGFGYQGEATPPYEFTSYAFSLDDDVLVAAWLDLPGLELDGFQRDTIEAAVPGVDSVDDVRTVDYLTGETDSLDDYEVRDGTLWVDVPVSGDPVCYLRVDR
jgi:hypothetical protein